MAKMRVHEVAKQLNKTSKELIAALRQSGIEVQSHMSTVTEEQVSKIREKLAKKDQPGEAPEPAKTPASQPAPEAKAPVKTPAPAREKAAPAKDSKEAAGKETRPSRPVRDGDNHTTRNGETRVFTRSGDSRGKTRDGRTRGGDGRRRDDRNAGRPDNRRNDGRRDDRRSGEGRGTDNRQAQDGSNRRNDRRNDNRSGEGRNFRDNNRRDGSRNDNRGYRDGGRNEGRGGDNRGGRDGGRTDNRRPDNRRDGNRNFRDNGAGRNAGRPDNRNRGGEGRRDFSYGADSSIPTKEGRSGSNRHEINREHSRDNEKRGADSRGNRGNRRNNKNNNNNYENNQKKPKNRKPQPAMTKPVKKETPKEEVIRNITLPDPVSLKDLAEACKVSPAEIIKKLFMAGKMVTINSEFSFDDAAEIALDYNCIAEEEVQVDVIEELLKEEEDDESKMVGRPPVVCVMGHVDHGKTSLLDAIRSTNVTAGEAGGITQHIGASVVKINDQTITFLDTPGHEAFTSMRLRGAQATDIAVLVVAADDGVMPQTIEAINHAKAAEVEVIVAVNKIDKEGANIDRVKQELTEYGLIAEDWGGDTVFVPVSAKTREGIDDLLEMICLTAEVLELKANPNRRARGLVIEAKLDKGRGPVATILIQKGTLHVGDSINIGHSFGKIRAMIDDRGRRVKTAGPSTPVEILGLNDVPFSGEVMVAHKSEKEARLNAEAFIAYGREKMLEETKTRMSLDDLFDQIQAGNVKELNIVVKADVQGSVEAVRQSLTKLSNEEVKINVIHGGVGAINESDVTLASASNAIIIGFNVRPDSMAKAAVEREKVDLRLYRVIYNAIEDIEAAIKGMLDPVYREKVIGHLEVRQIYKASGIGTIAGCYVTDGVVQRDCQARIVRDGIVIYEGNLASLKRFKDDVKEVKTGFECGIVFEKYNDLKEGDQIESFVMEEVPR